MSLNDQIKAALRKVQLDRKIEVAKAKFASDLDKHAKRYLRNQVYIDEIKDACGIQNE